jgi:hypothetical protein
MPLAPKEKALVQELLGSDSIAEAGRKAGITHTQDAHDAYKSAKVKMPSILDEIGATRQAIGKNIWDLAQNARRDHVGQFGDITKVDAPDIRLKANLELADMQNCYEASSKHGSVDPAAIRSQTTTVCLVVADPREAAALARLLAPGGSAGVVIDVDAQMDEDLGRTRHSKSVQTAS